MRRPTAVEWMRWAVARLRRGAVAGPGQGAAPLSDAQCIEVFRRRQRGWLPVAAVALVALGVEVVFFAKNWQNAWVEAISMLALVAFAVASHAWCRCPRCDRFVWDSKDGVPGWALAKCPHCDAPLRRSKHG